jgi:DNA-directed RNA polymerase I, II, and III subunit RPABC2
VAAEKEKMIPRDERKTTPYMTKYEKARVLGTRALQIRYADSELMSRCLYAPFDVDMALTTRTV